MPRAHLTQTVSHIFRIFARKIQNQPLLKIQAIGGSESSGN